MAKIRIYIFSILYFVIGVMSYFVPEYLLLAKILFVVSLVHLLDKLGKGIVIREMIALMFVFSCCLMPIFGYTTFNRFSELALLWVRFMPISADYYFGYVVPTLSFFCFALTLPIANRNYSDQGEYIDTLTSELKTELPKYNNVGLIIILVGVFSFFANDFAPTALQFFLSLFFFASFAGLIYVYLQPNYKKKKIILIGFVVFIFVSALNSGMFTLIVYMGATMFSFFIVGKKIKFIKKLLIFSTALFVVLIIQSVKKTYRAEVWGGKFEGNKAVFFAELAIDQVQNIQETFKSGDAFFPFYYRMNQGYNIAMVMRRFPSRVPYDKGEKVFLTIVSSFVPRFLWQDKPKAGGRENMLYYANYNVVGFSTNVSPLGEAWASFGLYGGMAFMVGLGCFIRWLYKYCFSLTRKIPALYCWLPVLFYQVTYSAEGDTLQIMNSLIKTSFFIFLIYSIIPGLFLKKEVMDKRKKVMRMKKLEEISIQ